MKTLRPVFQPSVSLAAVALTLALLAAPFAAASASAAAAHWQRSLELQDVGELEQAISETMAFRDAGGDPYLAAVRSGWLSYLNRDFGQAVRHYEAATKASPYAITPWTGLMAAQEALGKPERALRSAEALLRSLPEHFETLLTAGRLSYALGRWRDAAGYFSRAFEQRPEEPAVVSWLAWSLSRSGDRRGAARMFERLLILSPDHPYAREGFELTH